MDNARLRPRGKHGILWFVSSGLEDLVSQMTLRELSAKSGKSLAAIVAWALGGPGQRAPSRGEFAIDTKTRDGREVFDAQVLNVIATAQGPVGTAEIGEAVGGSMLQRRTALHRLVAAKKIRRTGVTRKTRYEIR